VEQQWWATAAERKEEAVQPSMQVLTTAPQSSPHRWVTAAESKEEVDVRMDELINQIHYCPHERIVLVRDCH
jgi:hypothetical protein